MEDRLELISPGGCGLFCPPRVPRPQLIPRRRLRLITRTLFALHSSSIIPSTIYDISHRPNINFIVSVSEYPSSTNQEINYCKENMPMDWNYRSDGNHGHPFGGDVRSKGSATSGTKFPPPPSILITITCKFCKKEYTKCKNAFAACPHCNNFQ